MKNRKVKEKLIELYGPECFIEKLHFRKDKQVYKGKAQYHRMKQLTFHHIRMKSKGGKATVENGALLSNENHAWFHKQDKKDQEEMNKAFQEYKEYMDALRKMSKGIPVVEDDIEPDIKVNAIIFKPEREKEIEDREER